MVARAELHQQTAQAALAEGTALLNTLNTELLSPIGNAIGEGAAAFIGPSFNVSPLVKPFLELACRSIANNSLKPMLDNRNRQLATYNQNTLDATQATQKAAGKLAELIIRRNRSIIYNNAAGELLSLGLLVYMLDHLETRSYNNVACKFVVTCVIVDAMFAWRQLQAQDSAQAAGVNAENYCQGFIMVAAEQAAVDDGNSAEFSEDFIMVDGIDQDQSGCGLRFCSAPLRHLR